MPDYGAARRFPRWHEIRALLRFQRIEPNRTQRRLRRALTIEDLSDVAMRRTPKPVFGYTEGAADDEIALARAKDAFNSVVFHPHVLHDVSSVDMTTTILGRPSSMPLALGPTGFTRMMHHLGESAVARAATDAGLSYVVSTLGTTPIERVVEAAGPDGDVWFQLYVWRDRGRSKELVDRAREARVRVLMLTVDVPVAGSRLRDARNGLTVPPTLTLRSFAQLARYPSWWWNVLTTEPLQFASLSDRPEDPQTVINSVFDPSVSLSDIDWVRSVWDGPLVVKGVQRVDDAVAIADAGVDGIVLSNHGGRQMDRAVVPLLLLPAVVDAVGDRSEIYVDTGVRRGADVAAAVALGARACFIGRAYLYGLMAGGRQGVDRAIEILRMEFQRAMQLLGATSVEELTPDLVTLPLP